MLPVCGACGHILDEGHRWARDHDIAQCSSCNAVVALRPQAPPPGGAASLAGQTLKHRHGSLQVQERGEVLELSWSWSVPPTLMALGVGTPLVLFAASLASSGAGRHREALAGPGLFELLVLSGGALFLYRMVSRLVNRTTLRLGPEGFHTLHGPLPWFGGPHLPREGIHRFCAFWRDDDDTVYQLDVIGADGERTRLLDFDDEKPALLLAQAFNARLGLEERSASAAPADLRANV